MRTSGGRWSGVTALIGRLFHVRYTLHGTCYLLHRIGCIPLIGGFLAQTGLSLEPEPP